jgi:hypothetical protein
MSNKGYLIVFNAGTVKNPEILDVQRNFTFPTAAYYHLNSVLLSYSFF